MYFFKILYLSNFVSYLKNIPSNKEEKYKKYSLDEECFLEYHSKQDFPFLRLLYGMTLCRNDPNQY